MFDDPELPPAVLALLDRPEVVGVFRGFRRRDGERTAEPVWSVRVLEKIELERLETAELSALPQELDGVAVDVVGVGPAVATSLDSPSAILGSRHRNSTAFAFFPFRGHVWALTSGHGVLPYSGGRIGRSYDCGVDPPEIVRAIGGFGTAAGDLIEGACGDGREDWGLVQLATSSAAIGAHSSGGRPPFALYRGGLSQSSTLTFEARAARGIRHGRFDGLGAVKLELPDGSTARYFNVVSVTPSAGVYSVRGDSGAMVVTDRSAVVGMVLGAARKAGEGYVLPVHGLRDRFSPEAWESLFR